MRIFLYGISALSFWLSASTAPRPADRVSATAMQNCEPTPASVSYLEAHCPQIPSPYHVSVPSRKKKRLAQAVLHVATFKVSGKPYCRIESGIYATSPELCFVQLARDLELHELVKAGNALCGIFRIDPSVRNGLGSRAPLTNKKRISSFLERNGGILGAKKARRALKLVTEKTASPPESFLAMVLGLPHRLGGYQLPKIIANPRVTPSSKARTIARRSTLVPDILCENARLDIEYDSSAEHTSPEQLTRDAQKRLALEADGYKVITVTARQIGNRAEMRNVAEQSHKHLGKRLRPQSRAFSQQHALLFRTGWSLAQYHRAEWLQNEGTP